MITIFKNKNDIPQDMEYIELNDVYFNQNTALTLDKKAEKLIEVIDGAKLISKFKILDKGFSGNRCIKNIIIYILPTS